mmetsp:Transcript_22880/g.53547  ORF Transcript_22880/g.53547 Transcript_22880/m.53547 type:complete len:181 (+) Transcript_22880:98-640(+)
MWQCRMCAESPFTYLFGADKAVPPSEAEPKTKRKTAKKKTRRDESNFQVRSEEEIQALVKNWQQYAHPRAQEFFAGTEKLQEVLTQLARGIDRNDDPVLGDEGKCVQWYGNVTKDDNQAAITMIKPGESAESVTFVNRVLAFIFATDDSFEQLMKLPKEPFKMTCGDQLCVHLAHISVAV